LSRLTLPLLALAAFAALGSACASAPATAPPFELSPLTATPTQQVRPGAFVWVDLVTDDVARAKAFYGKLFGWTFQGDDYVSVLHDGKAIGGIVRVARLEERRRSQWIANLSVADVDRAAEVARKNGGEIRTGPVDAPQRGRLALVSDPGGASVVLLRAEGGDPPDREAAVGDWLWRELWTQDPEAASGFYAKLVSWESDNVQLDGQTYRLFKNYDAPQAGLVEAPADVKPLWLPYVRVADAADTARRAEALGARVVLSDEFRAILVDPTGAAIGVQFWDDARLERKP
jgi:hypothetical protein